MEQDFWKSPDRVARHLGLKLEEMADICGVSNSQPGRWRKKGVPPWHRPALEDHARATGIEIPASIEEATHG